MLNESILAPDFPKDLKWLNTKYPLSKKDLKGHVVVLFFWTYGSINCLHGLEELKSVEEKYKDSSLVVLGVHSGKFENERDFSNVQSSIERFNMNYPVVIDNDFEVWKQYKIQAWPSFVVLNAKAEIKAHFQGEGIKDSLDKIIADLFEEAKNENTLTNKKIELLQSDSSLEKDLSFPGKIIFDESKKTIFISDTNNHRILEGVFEDSLKIKIKRIWGGKEGFKDGKLHKASLKNPQGLWCKNKELFICDTGNHAIRKINLETGELSTFLGTGTKGGFREPSGKRDPLAVNLISPWDIEGNEDFLYIAMAGAHQIWEYNFKKNKVDVLVGTGRENLKDGNFEDSVLAQPAGLSLVKEKLYFVDAGSSSLRQIDLKNKKVETLIGEGLFEYGFTGGDLDIAELQHPMGISAIGDHLYIADTYNHAIRKVDVSEDEIKTLVGKFPLYNVCKIGETKCNVLALFEPQDVEISGSLLYIADTNNHLIRCWDLEREEILEVKIEF